MKRPTARVTEAGAKRIRSGHPWVFRVDLLEAAAVPGGAVVSVVDETGNPLGSAFQAVRSVIALRMLTRSDEPVDRAFFRRRVEDALSLRRRLWPDATAYRVIHGEADLLPGLFVDLYGDALALQAVSEGAEALTPLLVELLGEALHPRVIVARNDTSARDFEGLPRSEAVLAGGPGTTATYREGESLFEIDLMVDHKTGAFLDQRENHLAATAYVPDGGCALDTFSYHGGFALALGRRAAKVIAVEQDPGAAARLRHNAGRNRSPVEVVEGNSFDVLRGYEREGRRFDTIVLDPPAFAKRKGDLPAAARAYKELNLRGLKLLAPGGVLITCSCSGKMTPTRFAAVLGEAISDSRRPVQLLERRGAARDHPVLPLVPETEYLKCWVYRAL